MAETLIVTQGKAMRAAREQGVVLELPSGNVYRLRMTSAALLLKRGNLPNILTAFATEMLYDSDKAAEKYNAFLAPTDKSERALEVLASYEAVCKEMFLEPKVVDNPQADDEISIDNLSLADQTWCFWLAFQAVNDLKSFRTQQELDVERVAEPQDVPQIAEPGA
jgi:hypothetical protein